ncbi:MAG TPA: trypsin-like peptidase domain-containing protein [Patescibacteria group bacterium]|jgi:S1-C subfamily serine protease|nr:trypsin-like peptidase domain-containing protein [Patescibacteria group bacterium]
MKQKALEKGADVSIDHQEAWHHIDKMAFHAVGQLFVQGTQFNWKEPYCQGEIFENVGSCFIIDTVGHLITSWHVVGQGKSLWVQFPSTGRFPLAVSIKSVCPDKDIALLQLHQSSIEMIVNVLGQLPALTFGNSDTVLRADSVMILGYPLMQYRIKSTTGIVSGKEMVAGQSLIQITAPVNPGTSGAPVFNRFGQVIGITACLIPEAQNIGFCVPSQDFFTIKDDLMREAFVKRPLFGVQFVSANDSKAELLGNPKPAGLYVSDVFDGGLCAKMGVQPGDMIYAVDDCEIDAYGDARVSWSEERVSFYELIGRLKIGQKISVTLCRRGEKIVKQDTVVVTDPFIITKSYPGYDIISYAVVSGLVIMQLTENHLDLFIEERPEFGIFWQLQNRLKPALIITAITPQSYSYELRIFSSGDLLDTVNGKKVQTIDDLKQALGIKNDFLTIATNLKVEQVIPIASVEVTFDSYTLQVQSSMINQKREESIQILEKDRKKRAT